MASEAYHLQHETVLLMKPESGKAPVQVQAVVQVAVLAACSKDGRMSVCLHICVCTASCEASNSVNRLA